MFSYPAAVSHPRFLISFLLSPSFCLSASGLLPAPTAHSVRGQWGQVHCPREKVPWD